MKEISGSTTKPSISTPGKHREAIIQSSGTRRVRRPGSRRQLRIIGFVFLIITAAIAGAYFLLRPKDETYLLRDYAAAIVEVQTIQDDLQLGGTVRARTEATVRAPVTGILESLAADVGDWVTPGQIVAILDAEALQEAYENLQQNLVQSNRAHESLLLAREQAKLISARVREDLEAALQEAKESLEDARELQKIGTITPAALKDAEDLVEAAQGALEDHDEDEVIAEKFHQIEKLNSEDNLEAIRKSIADIEEQLEETTITSPMEGRVVWTIDSITAIGNKINENEVIMQVADTRDPFVETVIEEQYVSDIALGQEVVVTISGQIVTGAIERIGLLAVIPSAGGAPEVDLDLSVEVENFEALPGGTALAELVVGVVPDALVLPRGPFLSTGNHLYLYKIDGNTAVRTEATFGAVTEQFVEIIAGVSAGDEIITSSYQNYIDFEIIDLGGEND
jgi:HlyD family secretion protein